MQRGEGFSEMEGSHYQEELLHLLPFKCVWPCGAFSHALDFRETDAWARLWYFTNLNCLKGLCASQETLFLKCASSVAGISHSSEIWRRAGGKTKAEGSNRILSFGELEQRRRPGIWGNRLGHWVTRSHPVAILQGKNKDLSVLRWHSLKER